MAQNCKSCGNLRDHTPDFGTRCGRSNNYPNSSRTHESSKSSSSSSSVAYRNSHIEAKEATSSLQSQLLAVPIIKKPQAIVNGVNLNDVSGWHVPTDLEIAKGVNPHFKMMPNDSDACRVAKNMFNNAINGALNGNNAVGAVGLVAEVVRIKKELNDSMAKIQKECTSKFESAARGSNIFISSADYHKYM